MGIPWLSRGQDSMLSLQEAQVWSLVVELRPPMLTAKKQKKINNRYEEFWKKLANNLKF